MDWTEVRKQQSTKAIVRAVRDLHPGYDRFLQSKVENEDRYGIRLTKRAEKAVFDLCPNLPHRAAADSNRTKPCRITVRLTDEKFRVLQQYAFKTQQTMQSVVEEILTDWIGGKNGSDD